MLLRMPCIYSLYVCVSTHHCFFVSLSASKSSLLFLTYSNFYQNVDDNSASLKAVDLAPELSFALIPVSYPEEGSTMSTITR